MADSACAVCGFSTNDQSDFEKHVQQHEDTPTTKQLDFSSLMNGNVLPNLPAMAGLFNLYDPSQMASLFSKLPPFTAATPSFLGATDMSALLAATKPLKDEPVDGAESPSVSSTNADTPKVAHSPRRKEAGKSKKVVHSCPHCNFTTVMSQHMKSHLEAHDRHQGQMYQCDVCQMQFSQKANMHRHRMRHSGFKPYECRFCQKRFFRKDQMQEHSMTHIKTGEDFDCPVADCPQRFRQHSSLRAHLDEQHTITPNEHAACKRCSMTFANSRRLLLHYQTKHEYSNAAMKREFGDSLSDDDQSETPVKKSRMETPPTAETTLTNAALTSTMSDLISGLGWGQMPPLGADAFSQQPSMLPKSKSPNCEALFNNFSAPTPLNFGNLTKFVEQLTNRVPQQWTNESQSTTSSAADDHSSTHSPTSDSRASSAPLVADAADHLTKAIGSPPRFTAALLAENLGDTVVADTPKEDKYDCAHCGIAFNDYLLFMFHKTLHGADQPWRCGLCGHECGDRFTFTTHIVQDKHST